MFDNNLIEQSELKVPAIRQATDKACKTKIKALKKINIIVDALVVAMLIVKLSATRHFPSLYSIGGMILASLAMASMALHITVFAMKKENLKRSDKIMFFEQGLGILLKITCIVLGFFVAAYFPERYYFAGQSAGIMRESNPEFWGLFRAYIAIGVAACVLSALHIFKAVKKYFKLKKCEKVCC